MTLPLDVVKDAHWLSLVQPFVSPAKEQRSAKTHWQLLAPLVIAGQPTTPSVKQKQPGAHWSPARGHAQSQNVHPAENAKAELSTLINTGAVHATAAPAPIRFRAVRREIPVRVCSMPQTPSDRKNSS
jgi:hypothetical protein